MHGLWAAVAAGLGVTLRTDVGLPSTLAVRRDLPPVPDLALSLHARGLRPAPAVSRLREILIETVGAGLQAAGVSPSGIVFQSLKPATP